MATSIGQLATELSRTNPWWRGPSWVSADVDLRPVTARGLGYSATCLDALAVGGMYLLRGPRRVGKTVAVKQAIQRLTDDGVPANAIVRAAVDGWAAKDLRTIVQNTALPPVAAGQPRWWFIDEVTAVTGDWATQIKWLRDNDPEFAVATVVLTGSSAEQLTTASGVLAGRRGPATRADRTLLPIGFATFARLLDGTLPTTTCALSELRTRAAAQAYDSLVPWLATLTRLWEMYLAYGGFPVSVTAARDGTAIPSEFIDDLFNVIYRDAFVDSKLSMTTTSALVERVMGAMASPLSLNNVAEDLGLAQSTVSRQVAYLRDAYLIWQCPQKADAHWIPRDRAQEKIYAVDPVIARLAHLRNDARTDIDVTVLAEMQLGTAIHRAAYTAGTPWADEAFLFYVRTPSRKEIDFVAEALAGVAIEGKYIETGKWASEAATVNASQWEGILATRSVLDTSSTDQAWAVPASFLAYLIDS